MTRLEWGSKPPMFDLGVDQAALYLDEGAVAWNGLIGVAEKDTGELDTDYYFDGKRFNIGQTTDVYESTLSAYTYPDEFAEYNGYSPQESYKRFGLSYRTQHGDSYRIHLVYNALIRPANRSWKTLANQISPSTFEWNVSGSPVPVPGALASAHMTLEPPQDPALLETIEDILYGSPGSDPRLLTPEEIIDLYESTATLRIIYHGDGSYTASGPDDMVTLLPDGRFQIDSPSLFLLDEDIFVVNSH